MSRRILIVGAGLAGSLTAWELRKRGESFTLIDNGSASASKVAAGMFNPVSFKRVVEVWNAEKHMGQMLKTYSEIEEELGVKIINKTPIMRVFPNKQYRDHWQSRITTGHDVARWLSPANDDVPEGVVAPFGFGLVKDAGWVNLPAMTDAIKHKLEQEGRFKKVAWSMSDGVPDDFDLVIDCRGVGAKQELNNLGFKLAADHGEVLTIDVGGLSLNNTTLNRVKWLMPLEGHFKLGATYEWSVENSVPTEAGKKELIDAISPALAPEVADQISIINHQSGLRPTSHDRRPYIGEVAKNIYALNGLGTRGVLVAPSSVLELLNQIT